MKKIFNIVMAACFVAFCASPSVAQEQKYIDAQELQVLFDQVEATNSHGPSYTCGGFHLDEATIKLIKKQVKSSEGFHARNKKMLAQREANKLLKSNSNDCIQTTDFVVWIPSYIDMPEEYIELMADTWNFALESMAVRFPDLEACDMPRVVAIHMDQYPANTPTLSTSGYLDLFDPDPRNDDDFEPNEFTDWRGAKIAEYGANVIWNFLANDASTNFAGLAEPYCDDPGDFLTMVTEYSGTNNEFNDDVVIETALAGLHELGHLLWANHERNQTTGEIVGQSNPCKPQAEASSQSGLNRASIMASFVSDMSTGNYYTFNDSYWTQQNATIIREALEVMGFLVVSTTTSAAYADTDGDGFGDSNSTIEYCASLPTGYVSNSDDCDDNDGNNYPGNTEICDGKDNDCDGQIDEGLTTTWYADTDGDGFGDPDVSIQACDQPTGYVADNTDCNDADSDLNDPSIDTDGDGLNDCVDPNPLVNVFDVAEGEILVYPNPVSNLLWIESNLDLDRVAVVTTLGRKVVDMQIQQNKLTYDAGQLEDGLYVLMLMLDEDVYRTTFIKQ